MHTILSAALRSRLVHRIQKALHTEKLQQDGKSQTLPLKQIRQGKQKQLEYVSAVALKYAQPLQKPALQLAKDLMEKLSKPPEKLNATLQGTLSDATLDDLQKHFNLEVAPPGWVFFRLADPGLAIWLQCLVDYPLPVAEDTSTTLLESRSLIPMAASARNSTSVFPILHTYARCHSVLRLGQQLGLIQAIASCSPSAIVEPDASFCGWQIQAPKPFPWLLPTGGFRGSQPAEWQLVEQICATLDQRAELDAQFNPIPDIKETLKQADRLSESWQLFYAACRIADEVGQNDPAQAQLRLGLTWITQKLLHELLRSIELPTPLFL